MNVALDLVSHFVKQPVAVHLLLLVVHFSSGAQIERNSSAARRTETGRVHFKNHQTRSPDSNQTLPHLAFHSSRVGCSTTEKRSHMQCRGLSAGLSNTC
jgi:hypothetical protein